MMFGQATKRERPCLLVCSGKRMLCCTALIWLANPSTAICLERRHWHKECCWFLAPAQGGSVPFAEGCGKRCNVLSLCFNALSRQDF